MFKAEVIGSMLRPPQLTAALDRRTLVTEGELSQLQDRAVAVALAIQERAGVDVVTDGEMRRRSFIAALTECVDGVTPVSETAAGAQTPTTWHGPDGDAAAAPPFAITATIRRARSLSCEEFAYAHRRTAKPVKVTLPSPMMLSVAWRPGLSDRAYADPFDAFRDGAEVIAQEIDDLADLGCTYVQIDAPELITHVLNSDQRDYWESVGIAPDRLLDEGTEILDSLAMRARGMRCVLHLCRGNHRGMWLADGGYETVSKRVFQRIPHIDGVCLEYDTPRARSFEPLRDLPDDKTAILGLVSTKVDALESAAELSRRLDDAARFFPREQLALSTQCGFASSAGGNPIAWETQERKLALVADVAHSALG